MQLFNSGVVKLVQFDFSELSSIVVVVNIIVISNIVQLVGLEKNLCCKLLDLYVIY